MPCMPSTDECLRHAGGTGRVAQAVVVVVGPVGLEPTLSRT